MRIRVLTGLGVWLLCGVVRAQTAAKPRHADRVVVLKKERTLQLLRQGKVMKTYKVALGGDPNREFFCKLPGADHRLKIPDLRSLLTFANTNNCRDNLTHFLRADLIPKIFS
jgi:hypothetical protein